MGCGHGLQHNHQHCCSRNYNLCSSKVVGAGLFFCNKSPLYTWRVVGLLPREDTPLATLTVLGQWQAPCCPQHDWNCLSFSEALGSTAGDLIHPPRLGHEAMWMSSCYSSKFPLIAWDRIAHKIFNPQNRKRLWRGAYVENRKHSLSFWVDTEREAKPLGFKSLKPCQKSRVSLSSPFFRGADTTEQSACVPGKWEMTIFRKPSENRLNCLNFCKKKYPKKWEKIQKGARRRRRKGKTERENHRSHGMLKKENQYFQNNRKNTEDLWKFPFIK